MQIKSYAEADAYLGKKSDRPGLSGKATRIHRIDAETIGVRYHQTDVVIYHADGRIELDSGGWRSNTTKARVDEYTHFRIWSDKGHWTVHWFGDDTLRLSADYADHMTWKDGKWKGAGKPNQVKAEIKLRKAARQYAHLYLAKLLAGELHWSDGDCMYCVKEFMIHEPQPKMELEIGVATGFGADGKPVFRDFDPQKDNDHLRQHIKENYFPARLVWSAYKMFDNAPVVGSWINARLHGQAEETIIPGNWHRRIVRMIAQYMYTRLGLAR